MDKRKQDKPGIHPRVWGLIVISNVLFWILTIYLIFGGGKDEIVRFLHWLEGNFLWFFGGIVAFIAFCSVLAWRASRTPPQELKSISEQLGIPFLRKWGIDGTQGRISFFGYGPYFEGDYRGHRLAYSPVFGKGIAQAGGRVTLYHSRPLSLGLFCRHGIDRFNMARMPDEYKEVFSEPVEVPIEGATAFAVEEEKAAALMKEPAVVESLKALSEHFSRLDRSEQGPFGKVGGAGFILNDRGITGIFTEPTFIRRDIVDAMAAVSRALTGSILIPAIPRRRLSRVIYRGLVTTLIGMIILSLIWVLLDALIR